MTYANQNFDINKHFHQLLARCSTLSTNGIKKAYNSLINHHNEEKRHYHNLNHIIAMLKYAEYYQQYIQEIDTVCLAIYYHDIIYDATREDNEEQSALIFQKQLSDHLQTELTTSVVALILATKKHQIPTSNTSTTTSNDYLHVTDCELFLDMDLSILGQSTKVYQQYCRNIRKEYQHVAENDYINGRLSVLKKFIQRDTLYFSDIFSERYEKKARENITDEIYVLNTKVY